MSNIREEYKCAKKSKFMQAVFIGALAGAAISLFDKQYALFCIGKQQKLHE